MNLLNPAHLLAAVVYSGIGLAVFAGSFIVMDKLTPYNLWEELVAKQNRALATVVGSISIGISIIIAASLAG